MALISIAALRAPVDPFVRVGVTVGVETFRTSVIEELFSGAGLPSGGFDTSNLDTTDPLIAHSLSPSNLDQYDEHTINILDNLGATVDTIPIGVWRPTSPNGKLVIQLLGHNSFANSLNPANGTHSNLVKLLVEGGYTVAVVTMAIDGGDGVPIPADHDALPAPNASLNPVRYFLDGPIKTINALQSGFSHVFYCGHSGGGWAGPLLMAVDLRIRAGVSNAGFFPLYMVDSQPDGRDYEQNLPGLWDNLRCDYLDLVVLSVTGGSNGQRTFLQRLTINDPVCFDKARYDQYAPYDTYLTQVCEANGGVFGFTYEAGTVHQYQAAGRTAIKALFDTY